ncbi:peptide ABC transporter substrate-binding protein [Akkermansiaceae bacterium]|nr:peptide ABC transporter substrate-binding protein [Akkermansiaceae bacterium]MDB4730926.1 peptide ABC transporter substrate-binding protein [Akkermansiaceae bacterium]MDB4754372.1 peptide ABC transporter substrate-binding protein [Akkermansiaceae bacterium]MDC0270323.1 peptide ABC transporter substrate-binding protein [bacterium]
MTRIIPLLATTALAFVSCERRSDIEIANEENILIIGNSNEPKGLDPHLVSGVLESNIIRALFEGLVVDHPSKDSHSVDGVAFKDQIKHSDDFTEWTFHLNPEAKWSDGVTVTAHDFVFSYKRLLSPDPNWPAKYAEMLYFLKNGEAYHRSKLGHILCGNDPDFPLVWETLREANFEGDSKIKPKKFKGKRFSELNEQDLKKFSPYLTGEDTPDFDELNSTGSDFEFLSTANKKVLFNSIGIDKLNRKQLLHLKDNLSLIKWSDNITTEVKQLVITRILSHHDAGKPKLWDKAQVGVSAINDSTLRLKLRGPTPYLLEVAKHYTWYPVPKHIILKHGEINTAYSSQWTKPENIVSNGPFKLKSWRTNHLLEVERNPHYWDAEEVKLDGIRYLPIRNYYTETRMFGDEQLHLTYTVPSELIPMAKEKYAAELRQESYIGTRFLRVNTLNSPFDNPKVRRAFALAIDQKSICEEILQGGQAPASGIVPPFGDYKPPGLIKFDPKKAKALLQESGYESTSSFPDIDLLTTNSDSGLREAEALQAMWQKHLGIKVRIQQREWSTYLQNQYDFNYDIVVAGWIGDYLDPTTFLELWVTDGGNNNTAWSSKTFEDLLRKAEKTSDITTRMTILSEAEETIMNDIPVLPIYWYTTNYLIRPEVKNWNPLLLNNHPFKFIEIDKN